MALHSARFSSGNPATNAAELAPQVAFYRFYLLRADDHIARRREDYFAHDDAAIAAAPHIIGDYPGVEIWCGPRKVVTLSREALAHLPPPVASSSNNRAARLIRRNKRLLQHATATSRYTEALGARMMWARGQGADGTRRGSWGKPMWQPSR